MLDIKYIRENKKEIKEAAENKNIDVDVEKFLELDEKRREGIKKIGDLRARRNEIAHSAKNGKPFPEMIKEGKKIKEEISALEEAGKKTKEEYDNLMVKMPIVPSADTPVGKDDGDNKEIYKWGKIKNFKFKPKSHVELGRDLDILDLEAGVKVSGYRGYYVKNEGAMLQMGLMMFALDKLIKKGFKPMIPPTLIKEFALFGTGYFSGKTYNPQTDEIYKIANEEKGSDGKNNKEDKFLIGTAEPSLLAYFAGKTLKEEDLPIKLCGFSQCYRSEIGSYGKDTKGIYRVHEFMKVEQVCIAENSVEESEKLHQEMIEISKELHRELGLPFRQLAICTGDMGAGKYKMYDLEAWIPSRNGYGETASASNFLDWQARRLNVKLEKSQGEKEYVYMLNSTAIPSPRIIIAILENYQLSDGSVKIPKVLRKYIPGNLKIIKRAKK